MISGIVDYFFGAAYSPAGKRLGVWGRLTVGWLWTDDPNVAQMHEHQDREERR